MPSTLLLTAGVGSRLDPLTRLVAKPAVPVAGQALVERILRWLRREGVRRAVLNLHHRPETITAIVGDGGHLGLEVKYSFEPVLLGSAGGPRHALPLFDERTLLIVNGDTLTDVRLAPLLAAHVASGADVTMAVVPNPARDHYNGIEADEGHRVTRFVERGHATPSWHFVGVQFVNAGVFESLPDGERRETVADIYRGLLADRGRVRVFPVDTRFLDVGTPADYLTATLAIAPPGASGAVVESGATIDASASLTRSIVWGDSTIGARAQLADCIVAGGASVPAGFVASRRVIVPANVARPGEAVDRGGVALFPLV